MQQSSATPKNLNVGRGLRKIVACSPSSSQCLLVPTVFGTVSSLHPISFLMIFILVLQFFYAGLAFVERGEMVPVPVHPRTYAHAYYAYARSICDRDRARRTGTVAGI